MSKFVVTIFLFSCPLSLWANDPAGLAVVLDLTSHWETYNDSVNTSPPCRTTSSYQSHIQFDIDFNKYKNYSLYLRLPPQHFLWFDRQLLLSTNRKEDRTFSIDSLYARHPAHKLRVTIYSQILALRQMETLIIDTKGVNQSQSSPIYEHQRAGDQSMNLFVIISLLAFAIIVLVRFFYFKTFMEYFSIRLFQPAPRFERDSYSLLRRGNLISLMLYGLICTAAAINVLLFSKTVLNTSWILESSEVLISGIKIGSLFIGIILTKYGLTILLSELFQFKKLKGQHFFMFLRYSLLIAGFFFFISIFNGVFKGSLIPNYLTWIVEWLLITYAIYLGVLFFNLNKVCAFQKVILFSYLCGSELVPFALLFKACLEIVNFA